MVSLWSWLGSQEQQEVGEDLARGEVCRFWQPLRMAVKRGKQRSDLRVSSLSGC